MVESYSHVDIGIAFVGTAIRFNVGSKNSWITGINARLLDMYRNRGRGGGFLKYFAHRLLIIGLHFTASVHNELGSIWLLQSKSADVGDLPLSKGRGGVGIFPP